MTKTRHLRCEAQVFKLETGIFLRMCEGVSTPRAQTCYMLAIHGLWDDYMALSRPDSESPTFADDYLVTNAMRKNPRMPLSSNPEEAARKRWLWAEQLCRRTNDKFISLLDGESPFSPETLVHLERTREVIGTILGRLSTSKLRYAESRFRFGPGSTSSVSGRDVVLSRKMTASFAVTPRLYPYWPSLLRGVWGREVADVSVRAYNKVVFVPKDAAIHRAIAVEPHGNIFVQLGIGALLRQQLRLNGLDLDNQADVNRMVVSKAHTTGYASIDLSSASDTISLELVRYLLPAEWFDLLYLARTDFSEFCGEEVALEKFSSMGNGYTFELETLIFWAMAQACCPEPSFVFGDDILLPQTHAGELVNFLEACGFTCNKEKTFLAGTFFESCGEDYWCGQNVRPIFFRGDFLDHTSAVIRYANKLRIYSHRRNRNFGCDIRFLPAWLYTISKCETARRTGVSLGCGDGGLVRNFDEFTPSVARHGHEGYLGVTWSGKPTRSRRTSVVGAYVAALAWGARERPRSDENERGSVSDARLRSQLISRWVDIGPWL